MTRTITVVSAGLRSPSSTRMLADRLAEATQAALVADGQDVQLRHVEVRDHAHAIADALLTGFPSGALEEDLAAVTGADAVIVVTPTFQATFAGLFKSFIDLVDPEAMRRKPVLLAATGGSERHSLVIDQALRPLFGYLGAVPVPTGVYAATQDFGGEGSAILQSRVERAAAELAMFVEAADGRLRHRGEVGPRVDDAESPSRTDGPAETAATSSPAGPTRQPAGGAVPVTPFAELLARAGVQE